MLREENRWLLALAVLWLVGSGWLLGLGDASDLIDDPPVVTLRVLPLVLLVGTAASAYLHVRANGGRRPILKASGVTVLLLALGWGAWIWTIDGHRASGPVMAVPICVVALCAGALAGGRPRD